MEDWREVISGDYIDLISGRAFKSKDFKQQKEENSLPVIKIKNVANGDVNFDDVVYHSYEENLKQFVLEKGDVLIAMTGNHPQAKTQVVGDVSRYKLNEKALLNQRVGKIVAKDTADLNFIYYLFKSREVRYNLANLSSGSANQANISKNDILNIELKIPPLPEQQAIASVLSSLDDKIDLLHRQNQTLEEMAESLFRQWFQPALKLRQAGVEEADEDWEDGELGDILQTIESGKRPKGGIDPNLKDGYPSIGAESINGIGNFSFSSTKYITPDFFKSMKRGLVKDFDVLIYKDGAYIGKKAMFGLGFPFKDFAINEHVFILRANEKANQFFLYFLLQQKELAQLNANSAQPGLNQKAMKSFEITIPPVKLVEDFKEAVKIYVEKILENSKQIQTLTQLRDTLMPKLMSGEIRVNQLVRC